jgi:hypothetical protein
MYFCISWKFNTKFDFSEKSNIKYIYEHIYNINLIYNEISINFVEKKIENLC